MNQELTIEIAPLKKIIPEVKWRNFTRKQTQATESNFINCNPIDKTNNFEFTYLKKKKKFTYEYNHRVANKKIMNIINMKDKSPGTIRLIRNWQKITKPGNFWLKFDSKFNRKVWVSRRPD